MKPYFSIIIPYHNSQDTIGPLLDSISDSKHAPPLEVIVVDDGSDDEFLVPGSWLPTKKKKKLRTTNYELRTIRLKANRGPAIARNRGAEVAKGSFLVFLDSDVRLFPDALANLYRIYREDPDITAVTGVWVKHQKTHKFFPNFKALRDWSYWIHERDMNGYYYLFSTRIASIKRAVFVRLKGFDESYAAPLVEDIEFTYRVARRYAIIFAPNVRVHHEFEDFWPIAKKYFWRSYYWTKLYQRRKKFDPVATTLQEAATALSGVGVVAIFIGGIIWVASSLIFGFHYPMIHELITFSIGIAPNGHIVTVPIISINTLLILTIFVHLYLIRKFLLFTYREKGLWFAIQSFFTGLILYCFIGAGALWGRVR